MENKIACDVCSTMCTIDDICYFTDLSLCGKCNDKVQNGLMYQTDVYYTDEHNETHFLGSCFVEAGSRMEARYKALDELWDTRLDSASCVPSIAVRNLLQEEYY